MHKIATLLAAATAFVGGSIFTAGAGTLIPVVPYPESLDTEPFDINDNNVIAGAYISSDSNSHAFFGSLDGHYTSFDGKKYEGYTQANGINSSLWITGVYTDTERCPNQCEFVRKPDGTFVTLTKDGEPLDGYARQIIANTQFSADFGDLLGQGIRSYLGKKAKYRETLAIDVTDPRARGLNRQGTVVGRFSNAAGHSSGFIFHGGAVTAVDYPDGNAVNTGLYGINDAGLVSGYWDTGAPDYIAHGFVLNTSTGTFHQFDVKGAQSYTYLNGINNAGFITVRSDAGNFIYCPKKESRCPKGGIKASFGAGIRIPVQKLALHHGVQNAQAGKAASTQTRSEDRAEFVRLPTR